MVVGVLVELANKNVDKIFDYVVPTYLEEKVQVGVRVKVPFSHMELIGFILEVKKDSNSKLKEVIDILDTEVILNKELLELGKNMHNELLCSLISCYQVMLPKGYKASRKSKVNAKILAYVKLNNYDSIIFFCVFF